MTGLTNNAPRPRLANARALLRDVLATAGFVVAVFTLLQLAIPRSLVLGTSMQPNFYEGNRLVISRLNYLFGDPQRGDIIVFNTPEEGRRSTAVIKRVIGMPGEAVEMIDQQIHINGERLEEPYIKEACRPVRCPDRSWTLGPNEYFVMGDNRNDSRDSRTYGAVSIECIIGEAGFRFWPLTQFGVVPRFDTVAD